MPSRPTRPFVALLTVSLLAPAAVLVRGADWPDWRGPARTGASAGVTEKRAPPTPRRLESTRGPTRVAPSAVERMARDNLGLVRQTEVVFQFPTRR